MLDIDANIECSAMFNFHDQTRLAGRPSCPRQVSDSGRSGSASATHSKLLPVITLNTVKSPDIRYHSMELFSKLEGNTSFIREQLQLMSQSFSSQNTLLSQQPVVRLLES